MLLTMKQMKFLSEVAEETDNGSIIAKNNLSSEDKQKLLEIDDLNYMTAEKHLIENYKELKQ